MTPSSPASRSSGSPRHSTATPRSATSPRRWPKPRPTCPSPSSSSSSWTTTSRTPKNSSAAGTARSSAVQKQRSRRSRSKRPTSIRCANSRRTPRRHWQPSAPAPTEADAKIASAEQSLTALRAKYADSALVQVADNITQAKERLAFVQNATATAQEKLTAGEGSLAAVAVRASEESLHQTNVLLDAIAKVSASLDEARQRPGGGRRRNLPGPCPGESHDPVR